jgi:hypothetical protein
MFVQTDHPDGDYCEYNMRTTGSRWWLDSNPLNLREAMGYLMGNVGLPFADAITYLRALPKWNVGMDAD